MTGFGLLINQSSQCRNFFDLIRQFKKVLRKTNFEVQRNFNANIALVVLFEICFRSLFFDIEKR